MTKKIFALILAITMMLTLSVGAFAGDPTSDIKPGDLEGERDYPPPPPTVDPIVTQGTPPGKSRENGAFSEEDAAKLRQLINGGAGYQGEANENGSQEGTTNGVVVKRILPKGAR